MNTAHPVLRRLALGTAPLFACATLSAQDPTNQELQEQIDALTREIERWQVGEAAQAPQADLPQFGFGPAASKVYQIDGGVSIGGYGEMVYSNFDSSNDAGAPSGKTDELDFLRGVLYFGYRFDENWLFNSEIEFEHASTSTGGSASVEFAYLEYSDCDCFGVRAGMLLLPMGFVNELHEPTTFLSANRPVTESVIMPSTWRENGAGVFGSFGEDDAFGYRAYVVNGLDGSGFADSGLRGGRQKGGDAKAEDFAWVARLDWEGVEGLLLGGSVYMGDSGQDLTTGGGSSIGAGTSVYEVHAQYNLGALQLRGLYSMAEVSDVRQLNNALGLAGADSIGEELSGWYLEAGFDVLAEFDEGTEASLTPFVRYEMVNTQESVPSGFLLDPSNDQTITTLGVAWQPFSQGIFKLDWQNFENEAGTGVDQFNFALGYVF